MESWIRTDRAGERRSRSGGVPRGRNRYARLMQVVVQHGYYAQPGSDGLCPDFIARPTPPTRELMRSLGLLFQPEAAGFSVLYDTGRAEGLLWYLRQHGTPPDYAEGRHWTRLSFVLSLTNPSFVNFTEIPVDTNPTQQNFYFTNQDAHRTAADQIVLNQGAWVDDAALLPVEGPEIRVETPPDVDEVVVLDIAGEPVLRVPRCVEQALPAPVRVCRNFIFLDFTTLPEDKYVIEKIGLIPERREILYTVADPIPLSFVDLLFTNPTPQAPGVYPVRHLYPEHDTTIAGVRYDLRFHARSTYWRYYIQPRPPQEQLENLAIETVGGMPPVPFAGPIRVPLINGTLAYRFVAEEPLRLQQRSSYWFRLKGQPRRAPNVHHPLIDRLPVAGSAQVLPEAAGSPPGRTYSDIYVYV